MNKIFKVVWSKVKNCYVVVSEIAKNIITGGVKSAKVGTSPLVKGAALGAMMAFVITGNVWAEDVPKTTSNDRIAVGSGEFKDTVYTGINTTSTSTGGVMNVSGKATFENCDFIGNKLVNSANTHGGVFYVSGNGDLKITDSTIKNNYVESTSNRAYGAVVVNSNAKVTIDNSTIDTNLAKGSKNPYGVVINTNGASSVTNISNTKFTNSSYFKDSSGVKYTTNGKDVIYMNGGTLNLENVSFTGYGISNFINGQANSGDSKNKINISGENNTFAYASGRAIWNRGILTFEEGSKTTFSGGIEIENSNDSGAIVNLEERSEVTMKNGIVGTGTVNFKGGTLNGKITGANAVNFNGGT